MSLPILDVHLRYVVEAGLKLIQSDPDRYLPDIFGNAMLEPHATLYGNRFLESIKKWFATTKIPVSVGFTLNGAEMPQVTIHLDGMNQSTAFLGDVSFDEASALKPYERPVLVPAFTPKEVTYSADRTQVTLTLPDSMSADSKALFLPGLFIRDADQQLFSLGVDPVSGAPVVTQAVQPTTVYVPMSGFVPQSLEHLNATKLEVISPFPDQVFSRGAMEFSLTALIVVHGHADRNEGLWLWMIVMWILLKFRPTMISLFGLDLNTPTSSDFSKDDSFMGENVWRRFITLSSRAVVSWEANKQTEILGLLLNILQSQASA